ncbi:MAG: hypothetical protein AABX04_05500 [Nanoarchaeota archaeon]
MINNNCPKCKINLLEDDCESINVRNSDKLALKVLFGKATLDKNISKIGFCDLCGATVSDILNDKL